MASVVLLDLGLLFALLGVCSLVRPFALLGIRTRRRAALLLGAGIFVAVLGGALPAPEQQVAARRTRLDEFAPAFRFHEVNTVRVRAPKAQVYRAIREVRADEILFFRTLIWLRRFGRAGPESILNAPEQRPLLDVALRTTFLQLAEEPECEIVIGAVVMAPSGGRPKAHPTPADFQALGSPGFAKATMNFLVAEAAPGVCLVTTETRVYATDAGARQRFAAYWRVIYPGSALIRRMWLRAVRLRAEAAAW